MWRLMVLISQINIVIDCEFIVWAFHKPSSEKFLLYAELKFDGQYSILLSYIITFFYNFVTVVYI